MPASREPAPSALEVELLAAKHRCRMCDILPQLTEGERAAVMSVRERMRTKNSTKEGQSQRHLTYQWLAGVLTAYGYKVTRKDVLRFVRGLCDC